jgi:hypothetical protein
LEHHPLDATLAAVGAAALEGPGVSLRATVEAPFAPRPSLPTTTEQSPPALEDLPPIVLQEAASGPGDLAVVRTAGS